MEKMESKTALKTDTPTRKSKIAQDAIEARAGFIKRFRDTLTKPITMLVILTTSVLTVAAEHLISRGIDELWAPKPPADIVRLNANLQESTHALQTTTSDLQQIIASVAQASANDEQVTEGLNQLSEKLAEFDTLLKATSLNTAKITTYSEALQEDFLRLQQRSDGMIDGVPNLVLGPGEAVLLCEGAVNFGIHSADTESIRYSTGSGYVKSRVGKRVKLKKGVGIVDLIGLKDGKVLLKVECAESRNG